MVHGPVHLGRLERDPLDLGLAQIVELVGLDAPALLQDLVAALRMRHGLANLLVDGAGCPAPDDELAGLHLTVAAV
jgi:hypothetical protein